MNSAERFQQTLAITLSGFETSLRQHVPPGAYRDFYLWGISADNPRRDAFLQSLGAIQLVKLTLTLLDGLVREGDWLNLASYSAPLNAYLTYEVASDNLAIGLAERRETDATYFVRHDLMYAFNLAMLNRLQGDTTRAAEALASLRQTARHVSSFNQSLNRDKQQACAEAYLEQRADLSLADLEYSIWPVLVGNVEAGVGLLQSMRGSRLYAFLRQGLIHRYQAVNRILQADALTHAQLAEVSAGAMLVTPTLTYYVAILAERIRPLARLADVIDDGTLGQAMSAAALIVRLLNDLGTGLITLSPGEREQLLQALLACYRERPGTQRITELITAVDGDGYLFNRLCKDIVFGEFNVGLYGLADIHSVPEALRALGHNLDYFAQLYAEYRALLQRTTAWLDERLGDERVSLLILRFVRFHEELYQNPYRSSTGEYAI